MSLLRLTMAKNLHIVRLVSSVDLILSSRFGTEQNRARVNFYFFHTKIGINFKIPPEENLVLRKWLDSFKNREVDIWNANAGKRFDFDNVSSGRCHER
jgi:hypothetical protein